MFRTWIGATIAIALGGLLAPLAWTAPIRLVWNASPSAPLGLYWVDPGYAPSSGMRVIARVPASVRELAARRGYLPSNVPLVKRVGAAPGDRVCAVSGVIRVNGRTVASRRFTDGFGRRMPEWSGCLDLGAGEYFLFGERPDSFDGRYFGKTSASDLLGTATLLWPR